MWYWYLFSLLLARQRVCALRWRRQPRQTKLNSVGHLLSVSGEIPFFQGLLEVDHSQPSNILCGQPLRSIHLVRDPESTPESTDLRGSEKSNPQLYVFVDKSAALSARAEIKMNQHELRGKTPVSRLSINPSNLREGNERRGGRKRPRLRNDNFQ